MKRTKCPRWSREKEQVYKAAMRWYDNWNTKWISPPSLDAGWDEADTAMYHACAAAKARK